MICPVSVAFGPCAVAWLAHSKGHNCCALLPITVVSDVVELFFYSYRQNYEVLWLHCVGSMRKYRYPQHHRTPTNAYGLYS